MRIEEARVIRLNHLKIQPGVKINMQIAFKGGSEKVIESAKVGEKDKEGASNAIQGW